MEGMLKIDNIKKGSFGLGKKYKCATPARMNPFRRARMLMAVINAG